MQRNFILTDVMKTGFHQNLENFIAMHSLKDQSFDMTGEYYTLHNYDLDSYDRKFAMIDIRGSNARLKDNTEFKTELKKRCDYYTVRASYSSRPTHGNHWKMLIPKHSIQRWI